MSGHPLIENKDYYTGPRIEDWARWVSFQPQLYFRPQSLEELKGFLIALQGGTFKQRSLRVLGGLHSCAEICVSDVIVDVCDLPKTLEFNVDRSIVTVSANWHFHEFLLALSQQGKSITATGGTDEQTLAGIISTNTAPATPHHTIYELVEWIEYITLDEITNTSIEKRVHKDDPEFPAVICSLGAIGILTKLQLRVVDELYFETVQKIVKLDEFLKDVNLTSQKYDFWRIDWIPDTDVGLIWTAKRIPLGDKDGNYPKDQSQNILEALFDVLDKVESAGPFLDNSMRLIYTGLTRTFGVIKASGPMRNMLPVDRTSPLHVAMAEWSFNPADIHRLLDTCRKYFEKTGWPNLPIEIELTKTDNYFMSPWNWAGLDYIVKLNFMYLTDILGSETERATLMAHLEGLWEELIRASIPFKAHWGKINFMDEQFVHDHFQFDRFEPFIRPIFVNPYLAERIYPNPRR
jgi:D-arabinono-1,4-lactone oxidase/FAD binding domain